MSKKGKHGSDDDFDLSKSASDEGSDPSEFGLDEEEIEEEEILTSLEAEELEELQEEIQSLDGKVGHNAWDAQTEQVWDDFDSGLPPPWPCAEVVNLDRKMTSKQKRLEFEPIESGKLSNISNSFNGGMETLESTSKTEDTWKALEKDQLFSYLLHYGYYSKDQYSNVFENLDKSVNSLDKLRAISPDTPLLFLTCLYRLLIFWGHITPLSIESRSPTFDVSVLNAINFNCFLCSKDCSSHRFACINMHLVICPECFQLGRFPEHLSSQDFEGQTNAVGRESTAEINWDEDQKYLLLKLLAGGEAWEGISKKLQKSISECQFAFLTIGNIKEVVSTTDSIKKLIGKSPNPLLQLATTLAKCVHPGLGAEVARAGLDQLFSCHRLTHDVNFAAAAAGFDAAIKKAEEIANFENKSIEVQIQNLIRLEAEVLDLKLQILTTIGKEVKIPPNN